MSTSNVGNDSGSRAARWRVAVLLAAALILPLASSLGQTAGAGGSWTVAERGLFYRVMQQSVAITNTVTGQVKDQIQTYTVLQDGMNFWNGSAWTESQEVIDLTPDGAQAVYGPMKAGFSSEITSLGAISLTTAGGDVLLSHPLGLYYFDSSAGKVAQVASAQAGPSSTLRMLWYIRICSWA